MSMINIDKVKQIVDTLVKGKVIDKISTAMDNGFGEVIVKVGIQNGVIKIITTTETETVKIA